jgi:polyphosphate kinase
VGLFTADERITREVSRIFSFLETQKLPKQDFEHLLVGQFNLKDSLFKLIDNEIKLAKSGKKGQIILKMNSLQDPQMIRRLYEASQAGVSIKLIIRGICSLVPGVIGFSENIIGISIVDRYLEHARIFVFNNDGEQKVYISSADWMERNLNHRIETSIPIYSEKIKQMLLDLLQVQLNDNVKGRIIDDTHSNAYQMSNIDMAIRSQVESYYYIKRMIDKELRSMEERNTEIN